MTGSTLVLIACLCQAPTHDTDHLVAQLGASRFTEREKASEALERLGRTALPALRAARLMSDLEVRTRAASLITRIEGSLLTQPTMLSLDFESRPLPEVLKALSQQSGIQFVVIPENSPIWAQRRVTIVEKAPLPFWQAIDRICEAGGLQYNNGGYAVSQSRQPTLAFFEGSVRPSIPHFDSGPFRISVLALHYQRDVTFPALPARPVQPGAPPRPAQAGVTPRFNASTSESFYAQLQVASEPRLSVSQSGPLKITEATDDKGQNLVDDAVRGITTQRTSGYMGIVGNSGIQLQAMLTRPESPGRSIRRLRGVLPVLVSTKKANPLTFKLEGANGKTFRNEDVAVTLVDQRRLGNTPQMLMELSVQALASSNGANGNGAVPNEPVIARPDSFQQQLEIVDRQGRAMRWYQTNLDMENARVTVSVSPLNLDANAGPVEIRFYSLARASTEIAFEFRDLPLP